VAIVYRPARAQELEKAENLVISSINDLTQRHGFGAMASLRPPHFQLFSLRDDPDGLWTAEEDGQILGFAFSWVCGELWFLAELFVAPDQQGRGIGNELLTRTMDHARKAKASTKALITFAFNAVSQGLYIRHGLFPKFPLYLFTATSELLRARLQGPQLRAVPIDPADMPRLVEIDARALGVSREKHHRYLLADGAMTGVMLRAGDERIGYAYISGDGHIGPLAVIRSDAVGTAFQTALQLAAASGAAQVSAFIPGPCDAALGIAVAHGMRIAFPMMLMSSRDFGDWSGYLPRNPGFM
jgi:ribosomal protein S18 acetylase RimI-like enzyme